MCIVTFELRVKRVISSVGSRRLDSSYEVTSCEDIGASKRRRQKNLRKDFGNFLLKGSLSDGIFGLCVVVDSLR